MDPVEEYIEEDVPPLSAEELAYLRGQAEALKNTHAIRENDIVKAYETRNDTSNKQNINLKKWLAIATVVSPIVGAIGTFVWQQNERLNVISARAGQALARAEAAEKVNNATRADVMIIRDIVTDLKYQMTDVVDKAKVSISDRANIRLEVAQLIKGISDRIDAGGRERELMAVALGKMEQQVMDLKDRVSNKQGWKNNGGYPWPIPLPAERAQR